MRQGRKGNTMKKIIAAAAIITAVLTAGFAGYMYGQHQTESQIIEAYEDGHQDGFWAGLEEGREQGFADGIEHAIEDSELFVVDLPDRNEHGGFDEDEITVYTYLDGQYYEYGCTIG